MMKNLFMLCKLRSKSRMGQKQAEYETVFPANFLLSSSNMINLHNLFFRQRGNVAFYVSAAVRSGILILYANSQCGLGKVFAFGKQLVASLSKASFGMQNMQTDITNHLVCALPNIKPSVFI